MKLPEHAEPLERLWRRVYLAICAGIFAFLVAPVLIIIPLGFNAEPYFSFTHKMLALDPEGYSLRWYALLAKFGMSQPDAPFGIGWLRDMWSNSTWLNAAKNSMVIGVWSTILATTLGTLAALGLVRDEMPCKRIITAILLAPMIIPIVIIATGLFFFYSNPCGIFGFDCGRLTSTYTGLILAHTTLGIPFVVITVKATLTGFDGSLARAAASLGASPTRAFFKVVLPLILPGVVSGALFAFATSFDEVVTVLFIGGPQQITIPRQMWGGLREQVSPAILAAATILIFVSAALLTTVELLRRRSERLRGMAA
ncbi:ABC transporter permease [Rhizobium sp. BK068]|uniref:ABC transporter permease n=1 Tax=Rhizobium sp. BK068 TaxID=2512130 RepID=UPI0010518CA5|nr:ABC transporter permease [Rhizobium sp. BK068]TCM74958.1 putative spermidine/putrescine transport system permease protein [Rhizobium sp. BK068]